MFRGDEGGPKEKSYKELQQPILQHPVGMFSQRSQRMLYKTRLMYIKWCSSFKHSSQDVRGDTDSL